MKRVIIMLIAALAVAGMATNSSASEKIKLKLVDAFKVDQSVQIRATLASVDADASKKGLDESILYGTYKTSKVSGGFYRVTIDWHTIGSSADNLTNKEALNPHLKSRFKTNQAQINSGEVITAIGDLATLERAYSHVKTAGQGDTQLASSDKNGDKNGTAPATTPLPANSGATTVGVPTGTGSNVSSSGSNGNLVTTQVVACDLKIDLQTMQVFKQERRQRVDQNGNVVDPGTCSIAGTPIPITKTYGCQQPGALVEAYTLSAVVDGSQTLIQACTDDPNKPIQTTAQVACPDRFDPVALQLWKQESTVTYDGTGAVIAQTACADVPPSIPVTKDYASCPVLPDYVNLVVHDQYRYTATVNGSLTEVQPCTPDTTSSYPIVETTNGCKVRDDVVGGKSFQQVRLVFTDRNLVQQELRACQDSTNPALTYTHFNTSQTCTVGADPVTGNPVLYQRTAYYDSAQLIQFVTACAPTSASIREEYCQTLTNNFSAGESYMNTRKYFLDNTGARIDVNAGACTPTYLKQGIYPHKTIFCNYNHYDTQHISKPVNKITVDTTADALSTLGAVDIQLCTEANTPITHTVVVGSPAWKLTTSTRVGNFITVSKPGDANYMCTLPGAYPTNTDMQNALNATYIWADGKGINTLGWSKDFVAASCTNTSTGVYDARQMRSVYTCTRTCGVDRNTYIKTQQYSRPDTTTYWVDDQMTLNPDVSGGTTAQPLL